MGFAEGSGPTLGEAVTKMGDGVIAAEVAGALVGFNDGTAVVGWAVGSGPTLGEAVT